MIDKSRDARYRRLYGITLEDYNRMYKEQGGKCAICGSKVPKQAGIKHFHVDHSPVLEKVRGLLCSNCNRGLGLFEHSRRRLMKAALYLFDGDK